MKILLIGDSGQLGSSLKKRFKKSENLVSTSRKDIDLLDTDKIIKKIELYNPNIIINAAGFTDVDLAETEYKKAYSINSNAIEKLAQFSYSNQSLFVHYSTDYVFDGKKNEPYVETDKVNPINTYGKSKLEGEEKIIKSKCKYIIFRTSWVYSSYGINFPIKILDAAKNKTSLKIVKDQIGSPTHTDLISKVTEICIKKQKINSLYHIASKGEVSWFDFAKYLINGANKRGVKFKCKESHIEPISSKYSKAIARRPKNSLLDSSKIKNTCKIDIPKWQVHADLFLDDYLGERL